MVLAGPGAGKTMVITNRVKYLIERHGVEPERILVVTLEDAAALEAYQNDPYHVNVVKKHMHAVREASIAVDYEI